MIALPTTSAACARWRATCATCSAPSDALQAEQDKLLEKSRALVAVRRAGLPRPKFPDELPVNERRAEIAALIAKHQVVIVCGETGSGKTTKLPKICLELGSGLPA